jgi:uncharacterized membrane protein
MATHRESPPPSRRSRWKLFRIAHGHRRLLLAFTLALFIFAALTASGIGHAATRFLVGWDLALLLYLPVTLMRISRFDLRQVQLHAAEQDEGAIVMLGVTVLAAIASLVAVVAFLGGAKAAHDLKGLYFAFAAFTILLSWCAIHTIFALHYAHEFYGDGRDRQKGGLIFPGDPQPDHWDFMYFSFVVGMTFQVSDVQVTSKSLRHVVVAHGIISFIFSVAILALAVNIGSGLI